MTTGFFVSESNYYAAGNSIEFIPSYDSTPLALNNGKLHGIIYTSDMSLTSCYSMPASTASSTSNFIV